VTTDTPAARDDLDAAIAALDPETTNSRWRHDISCDLEYTLSQLVETWPSLRDDGDMLVAVRMLLRRDPSGGRIPSQPAVHEALRRPARRHPQCARRGRRGLPDLRRHAESRHRHHATDRGRRSPQGRARPASGGVVSATIAAANLRLLPGLDAEIDELLEIRAEMVSELRDEGITVRGRRAVDEEETS
jgi:hypothetical protein